MLPFITQNNSSVLLKVEDDTCSEKNHSGGGGGNKKTKHLISSSLNYTPKKAACLFKKAFPHINMKLEQPVLASLGLTF